jgi:hypothetical protein
MTEDWARSARHELLRLQDPKGGWGYRSGSPACVEPSALAALALAAGAEPTEAEQQAVRATADWLAAVQSGDGSLGVSAAQRTPGWTTPYALLLWTVTRSHQPAQRNAAAWLLRQKGRALPRSADPEHIVGHDTTLIGWPWVADTHSWLEPTALAVLALRASGAADHPRVREGLKLIADRAISFGGWNYGNKAAFGADLRPQPAPTGLALLALAGAAARTEVVARGLAYLGTILPETRAPASLGWGVLGLRAWGTAPAEVSQWLDAAYRHASGRPDSAKRLALLLLAAGAHALEVLEFDSQGGRND